MPLEVTLIDYARDPLQKLYGAYRTCYTPKTPSEVWGEIRDGRISEGKIREFVQERLDYVMPKTWEQVHGMADEYDRLMREITRVYELALAKGIPAEDARFVLPNATPTNFQVMVNFAELLHIADLRLCWRAQWEIRHMVALMRREVMKAVPEIGAYLQPKCGDKRMGYCDEPRKEWERCPLGKVRPHKEQMLEVFREYRAGNLVPLGEEHLRTVEDAGNEE